MKRGYQRDFSLEHKDEMFNEKKRGIKAQKAIAVIDDYLSKKGVSPSFLRALDIGCSAGLMTAFYGAHFGEVHGIDIDRNAVGFARANNRCENVSFIVGDGMAIPYPDGFFDLVICTHIYEHVPSADRLIDEIYRILKPSGICFFAAGNRIVLIEGHYRLPLLSVFPKPISHIYLKLMGKGDRYYEEHRTFWGLKRLVRRFSVIDYTRAIIVDPERFYAIDMVRNGSMQQRLALVFLSFFYFLSPTYIWLLVKNK